MEDIRSTFAKEIEDLRSTFAKDNEKRNQFSFLIENDSKFSEYSEIKQQNDEKSTICESMGWALLYIAGFLIALFFFLLLAIPFFMHFTDMLIAALQQYSKFTAKYKQFTEGQL